VLAIRTAQHFSISNVKKTNKLTSTAERKKRGTMRYRNHMSSRFLQDDERKSVQCLNCGMRQNDHKNKDHPFSEKVDSTTIMLMRAADHQAHIHWGYQNINLWYKMHPSALGDHQSPINISSYEMSQKPVGVFYSHYHDLGTAKVINTGHTVVWEFMNDAGGVILNDKNYKLLSFHFHSPTEHTWNNKHLDMCLHFVHMLLETGEILVMAYNLDRDGEDVHFQEFLDHIQPEMDEEQIRIENVPLTLVGEFEGRFIHYTGSLTTPPCTQMVKWFVSNHCHSVDQAHLDWFRNCIPKHNHRFTQPRNERNTKVYEKRKWSKHFQHILAVLDEDRGKAIAKHERLKKYSKIHSKNFIKK